MTTEISRVPSAADQFTIEQASQSSFGSTLDRLVSKSGDSFNLNGESSGGRRSCAEVFGPDSEAEELMSEILDSSLINTTDDGSYHHNLEYNIQLKRELQSTVSELAGQNKIRVILPFVDEESTVGGVALYARDLTNSDSVIAVNAVSPGEFKDEQRNSNVVNAIRSVEEAGVEVVDQKNVLSCINWRNLYADGILPGYNPEIDDLRDEKYSRPPGRGKGLTMLAGILTLYMRDKDARAARELGNSFNEGDILEDDVKIVFHDTDVANPQQYAALEHIVGMPALTEGHEDTPYVKIARMGQGRNNHPVASAVNRLANSKNVTKSKLGTALQLERWHLSGEQSITWERVKDLNWINGMCIEMLLNIQKAGQSIDEGRDLRVQVADVQPKLEGPQDENSQQDSAGPAMSREWKMIYSISDFLQEVGKRSKKMGLPNNWGVNEISKFNSKFACTPRRYTVEVDEAYHNTPHHNIKYVESVTEAMLPSLNLLDRNGYIL